MNKTIVAKEQSFLQAYNFYKCGCDGVDRVPVCKDEFHDCEWHETAVRKQFIHTVEKYRRAIEPETVFLFLDRYPDYSTADAEELIGLITFYYKHPGADYNFVNAKLRDIRIFESWHDLEAYREQTGIFESKIDEIQLWNDAFELASHKIMFFKKAAPQPFKEWRLSV